MHEAMQCFKTWVNSWATSSRYHEPVIYPCLLGCPDKVDSLSHYLLCPILWQIANSVACHEVPDDTLERIGVRSPTPNNLNLLACIFHSYHAIKHVRAPADTSLPTLNFPASTGYFDDLMSGVENNLTTKNKDRGPRGLLP